MMLHLVYCPQLSFSCTFPQDTKETHNMVSEQMFCVNLELKPFFFLKTKEKHFLWNVSQTNVVVT